MASENRFYVFRFTPEEAEALLVAIADSEGSVDRLFEDLEREDSFYTAEDAERAKRHRETLEALRARLGAR